MGIGVAGEITPIPRNKFINISKGLRMFAATALIPGSVVTTGLGTVTSHVTADLPVLFGILFGVIGIGFIVFLVGSFMHELFVGLGVSDESNRRIDLEPSTHESNYYEHFYAAAYPYDEDEDGPTLSTSEIEQIRIRHENESTIFRFNEASAENTRLMRKL